jgi:1,4-alpha-glucan branching enzyme
MPAGCLSLILHAHLPFVRHPEHQEFLEEDWLFEAITGTYLPLLDALHALADEGVPFRIAMSVTPTLGHMLGDDLLRARYTRHLERLIALAENEVRRCEAHADEQRAARFFLQRFETVREWWEHRWQRDIVSAFRALQDRGHLEIIACAATHGFLPLMAREESVRAQIEIGIEAHRAMFGCAPRGMWLPECAWRSGLDRILAENGIRWCVLDSHGLMLGSPRPQRAIFAPVFTPAGVAAFGRERESARQVWSASEGYPGDPWFRDFYRDAGWDMPEDDFRKFFPDGMRRFTGLKMHRITGGEPKLPYDRASALGRVHEHARHFVGARIRQLREVCALMPVPPVVVCPFDAELFGHWWFEGPEWLAAVLRGIASHADEIRAVTPGDYLAENETHQIVEPAPSTWGDAGFSGVWLDPSNAWIYPALHDAEEKMNSAARLFSCGAPVTEIKERCLRQLARELLLAQSSDWAFLIRSGTAREYATRRTRDHLDRFARLHAQLRGGRVETEFLENCEHRDNIFPRLSWRTYA